MSGCVWLGRPIVWCRSQARTWSGGGESARTSPGSCSKPRTSEIGTPVLWLCTLDMLTFISASIASLRASTTYNRWRLRRPPKMARLFLYFVRLSFFHMHSCFFDFNFELFRSISLFLHLLLVFFFPFFFFSISFSFLFVSFLFFRLFLQLVSFCLQ